MVRAPRLRDFRCWSIATDFPPERPNRGHHIYIGKADIAGIEIETTDIQTRPTYVRFTRKRTAEPNNLSALFQLTLPAPDLCVRSGKTGVGFSCLRLWIIFADMYIFRCLVS